MITDRYTTLLLVDLKLSGNAEEVQFAPCTPSAFTLKMVVEAKAGFAAVRDKEK